MRATKRTRLTFDEPTVGPLDVKVFDGEGNLLRIIPGAVLLKRKLTHQRGPEMSLAADKRPTVGIVRARRREERP